MNRKPLKIAFGFICIAAGLWLCFREPSVPSAEPGPAISKRKPQAKVPVSPPLSKPAEPWPAFGTPEFKTMALERGEKWLNSRGRDAAGLVAAWDITGEESLLQEAAKNFPNDPRVCISMINFQMAAGKNATEWIDRLAAAEPQNPAALYLRAAAQRKSGDSKAAVETLRQAVKLSGNVDLQLRDRMMTVREATLASGAGLKDAANLTLMAPFARGNAANYAAMSGHRALTDAIKKASEEGRTGDLMELSSLSLTMVNQFAKAPAPLMIDQLSENTWRIATLKAMPGETEYGETGTTVAQQLEAAIAKKADLTESIKLSTISHEWIQQASEAEVSRYVDTWLLHGELEALKLIGSPN